jgi:hypothetical protein
VTVVVTGSTSILYFQVNTEESMRLLQVSASACYSVNFWNLVRLGVVLVLLLQFSPPSVMGQGIVTGSIAGTVQDQQGAIVAGAAARATDAATGASFTAKTDSQGYFEFRSLPLGSYGLTFAICT